MGRDIDMEGITALQRLLCRRRDVRRDRRVIAEPTLGSATYRSGDANITKL